MKKRTILLFFGWLIALVSSAQNINVASYNLRMNTASDGINAWPNRKEAVKALIQYHDFDIFGTQEGFVGQLKDLATLPEYAYIGVGRDDGKEAGEHSAIFYKKSRFEVLDKGDFWLSETPEKPSKGWDATCCNRICSWGKFKEKKTGKVFFFFSVHFDHQGIEARRQSGFLMANKIQAIAQKSPVICVGDFNSDPSTEQIKTLQGVLQDAYLFSKTKPYGAVGTFNGFDANAALDKRIDYVFVDKHFVVEKYAALTDTYQHLYPSDHLPVVCSIRFL